MNELDIVSYAGLKLLSCLSIQGFYIELIITAVLLIVICSTNDKNATPHHKGYGPYFPPLMVAFTVAILIACFGPLTAACLNPVRDLGTLK